MTSRIQVTAPGGKVGLTFHRGVSISPMRVGRGGEWDVPELDVPPIASLYFDGEVLFVSAAKPHCVAVGVVPVAGEWVEVPVPSAVSIVGCLLRVARPDDEVTGNAISTGVRSAVRLKRVVDDSATTVFRTDDIINDERRVHADGPLTPPRRIDDAEPATAQFQPDTLLAREKELDADGPPTRFTEAPFEDDVTGYHDSSTLPAADDDAATTFFKPGAVASGVARDEDATSVLSQSLAASDPDARRYFDTRSLVSNRTGSAPSAPDSVPRSSVATTGPATDFRITDTPRSPGAPAPMHPSAAAPATPRSPGMAEHPVQTARSAAGEVTELVSAEDWAPKSSPLKPGAKQPSPTTSPLASKVEKKRSALARSWTEASTVKRAIYVLSFPALFLAMIMALEVEPNRSAGPPPSDGSSRHAPGLSGKVRTSNLRAQVADDLDVVQVSGLEATRAAAGPSGQPPPAEAADDAEQAELEELALEAVRTGAYREALRHYSALAEARPDDEVMAEAVSILEAKLKL